MQDKIVLITGGSGGIGKQTAIALDAAVRQRVWIQVERLSGTTE